MKPWMKAVWVTASASAAPQAHLGILGGKRGLQAAPARPRRHAGMPRYGRAWATVSTALKFWLSLLPPADV